MATFRLDHPWTWYVLWNAAAFAVAFIPNSFIEWLSHRFVLHSKAIVRFGYEEHDRTHHVIYRSDGSFSVPGLDYGIDFRFRDWFLFLVIVVPAWIGVELATGRPLVVGATLASMLWLQTFNVLHRAFHAPSGSWIERTRYFRFLREHHRGHHADPSKNLNVAFPPLADLVFGTLRR
jgi:hypothetical protein